MLLFFLVLVLVDRSIEFGITVTFTKKSKF